MDAAVVGMELPVVNSCNVLLVKWLKYAAVVVSLRTIRALRWMEIFISGTNPTGFCPVWDTFDQILEMKSTSSSVDFFLLLV